MLVINNRLLRLTILTRSLMVVVDDVVFPSDRRCRQLRFLFVRVFVRV